MICLVSYVLKTSHLNRMLGMATAPTATASLTTSTTTRSVTLLYSQEIRTRIGPATSPVGIIALSARKCSCIHVAGPNDTITYVYHASPNHPAQNESNAPSSDTIPLLGTALSVSNSQAQQCRPHRPLVLVSCRILPTKSRANTCEITWTYSGAKARTVDSLRSRSIQQLLPRHITLCGTSVSVALLKPRMYAGADRVLL